MNFYDHPQTLLEGRTSNCNWRGLSLHKPFLVMALAAALLLCRAEAFSQSIKLGYAALSATQVAGWMAKEGGYLYKYGIEAEYIYIPAVAATQALIAGEIQLAQVTGVCLLPGRS
jgi:hypothetical protein